MQEMQVKVKEKRILHNQYPVPVKKETVSLRQVFSGQAVYCVRCQVLYKNRLSLDGLDAVGYLMLERMGHADCSLYRVSDEDFDRVQRHQIVDACIYYDNHQPAAKIIMTQALADTTGQLVFSAKKRVCQQKKLGTSLSCAV